ncbi:hypothetical protein C7B64_23985 [Merismopedia glauca CCAP 1448/3]|uniref:Uncharacterized protein n=1 Tax=Merismopedia glauca CCAP 1448/3 TaxID=1296344 RepID=A0A2T1BWG3_9CYAN|nr:hypothetical protein C7B64_23985 [Merismopedia glauca CCAP 1448/3]
MRKIWYHIHGSNLIPNQSPHHCCNHQVSAFLATCKQSIYQDKFDKNDLTPIPKSNWRLS